MGGPAPSRGARDQWDPSVSLWLQRPELPMSTPRILACRWAETVSRGLASAPGASIHPESTPLPSLQIEEPRHSRTGTHQGPLSGGCVNPGRAQGSFKSAMVDA